MRNLQPVQAEMTFRILTRLFEDVVTYPSVTVSNRKRDLQTAIIGHVPQIVPISLKNLTLSAQNLVSHIHFCVRVIVE